MRYLRATIIATLTGFATFVFAASLQAWLLGFRLQQAAPKVETGSSGVGFLGVFVWVVWRPSRESRA